MNCMRANIIPKNLDDNDYTVSEEYGYLAFLFISEASLELCAEGQYALAYLDSDASIGNPFDADQAKSVVCRHFS